jgi:hypothetical protein
MWLVFMNIMERPVSDIFSICVFNNIMGLTFIFSPRVFSSPIVLIVTNRLIFNNLMNS